MAAPLLQVDDLAKHYRLPRERLLQPGPIVQALAGVSFTLRAGQSLGIVGESGSGKSTLARLVMALETPTRGRVQLLGRDLHRLAPADLRTARRDFQMVFQDPYASLDPRQRIGAIVAEPLPAGTPAHERHGRVAQALEAVGLHAADAARYPHEFSGGQRQRIAIARALITRPRLIVADEPVSALDVSVQAQVLNLLHDLQQQFGIGYLLISHDLAVVQHVCSEVAVMYAGRIVEQGAPQVLFHAAAHPYTRALIDAVPRIGPGAARRRRVSSAASEAGAAATAEGCCFQARCAYREARCMIEAPALRAVGTGHLAACHRAEHVMQQPATSGHEAEAPGPAPENPSDFRSDRT